METGAADMTTTEARRAVMVAAWEIFRQTYKYPAIPFASIGRPCFAWALKEAHRRARVAAKAAAIPATVRAARIAELQTAAVRAVYADSFRQTQAELAAIERELTTLRVAA
jgi:hypothetical protein